MCKWDLWGDCEARRYMIHSVFEESKEKGVE